MRTERRWSDVGQGERRIGEYVPPISRYTGLALVRPVCHDVTVVCGSVPHSTNQQLAVTPMRRLTLDDIRLSRWSNVIAAPLWAFERRYGGSWYRIEEAWADIDAELARRWEVMSRQRDSWGRRLRDWQGCTSWPQHGGRFSMRRCLACGEDFMSTSHGHHAVTCTEACARARRKQTHVHSKQPRPHVTHEPRACDHCGEEFTPARADARYCSGKCRTAHHRGKPS
jgi:hypothetical protein